MPHRDLYEWAEFLPNHKGNRPFLDFLEESQKVECDLVLLRQLADDVRVLVNNNIRANTINYVQWD